MSDNETVRAWKDPEDAARATAPLHPSGLTDLSALVGGLAPASSEDLDTWGCCPSWYDKTC